MNLHAQKLLKISTGLSGPTYSKATSLGACINRKTNSAIFFFFFLRKKKEKGKKKFPQLQNVPSKRTSQIHQSSLAVCVLKNRMCAAATAHAKKNTLSL